MFPFGSLGEFPGGVSYMKNPIIIAAMTPEPTLALIRCEVDRSVDMTKWLVTIWLASCILANIFQRSLAMFLPKTGLVAFISGIIVVVRRAARRTRVARRFRCGSN
jgi:hypothetical protein